MRGWSLWLVCSLVYACDPRVAQPRPSVIALPVAVPRSPLECSTFSLLVNQSAETSAAVDPVETQMAVMQSRAFFAGAPSWLAPSGTMSVQRTGRSALISVRIEAQPSRAGVVCDWMQRRVLEMARSEHAQGLDWLSEQEAKLQHDADTSRDELAAFDKKNELLSVGLDLQIEEAQSELKALRAQHHPNDAALRSATDRALQLNLQQIERNRLAHAANATAKLVEVVRERRASIELESQLDRSVVLLDRCAACP